MTVQEKVPQAVEELSDNVQIEEAMGKRVLLAKIERGI